MRLTSLAAVVLFSSVALVGCGDDGGGITISKDKATTTVGSDGTDDGASSDDRNALIDYLADSEANVIDADQAACVADTAALSATGYGVARKASDLDLSDFSADDADELAKAFDQCIDFDQLVATFGDQMTGQAELTLTDDEAACAATEFAKGYSGSGDFIRNVSQMGDDEAGVKIFEALGPCLSDESAVAFMTGIVSSQGEDAATAQCVSKAVVGEMGAEAMLKGFAEAGTSGTSPDLERAMTTAIVGCGGSAEDVPAETLPDIGGGLSG